MPSMRSLVLYIKKASFSFITGYQCRAAYENMLSGHSNSCYLNSQTFSHCKSLLFSIVGTLLSYVSLGELFEAKSYAIGVQC